MLNMVDTDNQNGLNKVQHKMYTEHPGKAVEVNNRFKQVMEITLDPTTGYKEGIVRCITSREGDIEVGGYIDRSEIHTI